MAHKIVIREHGGPDVLQVEDYDTPAPGPGEVLVRMKGAAVNFLDVYQRSGQNPMPLPITPGSEAMGFIEAIGADVSDFREGQRVAVFVGLGGYASHIIAKAGQVFALPDHVSDDAASSLSRGLTVWMLSECLTPSMQGKTALVHAAAGGVGSILVPWLKSIGATVIAHSGSPEKAALARSGGADHSLTGPMDQLAEQVRSVSDGRGADVVYDGVGAASWDASLASVAHRGLLVSYGAASGQPPQIHPMTLGKAGSLFLTRPRIPDYTRTRTERQQGLDRLFSQLESGKLTMAVNHRFDLTRAADAHRALEERQTIGPTILVA